MLWVHKVLSIRRIPCWEVCWMLCGKIARGFVTALVAEHWLHQPGVLNLISGFYFSLFCLNCPIRLSCINAPISLSQMFCFTLDWCAENSQNSHVQLMLVHNFNMVHQQFLCCILSVAYFKLVYIILCN